MHLSYVNITKPKSIQLFVKSKNITCERSFSSLSPYSTLWRTAQITVWLTVFVWYLWCFVSNTGMATYGQLVMLSRQRLHLHLVTDTQGNVCSNGISWVTAHWTIQQKWAGKYVAHLGISRKAAEGFKHTHYCRNKSMRSNPKSILWPRGLQCLTPLILWYQVWQIMYFTNCFSLNRG